MSNEITKPLTLKSLLHHIIQEGVEVSGLKDDKVGFMIYDASQVSAELIEQFKVVTPQFADKWKAIYDDGAGFNPKTGKKNTARLYIGPVTNSSALKLDDIDSILKKV